MFAAVGLVERGVSYCIFEVLEIGLECGESEFVDEGRNVQMP
jgi:hypothetical protein